MPEEPRASRPPSSVPADGTYIDAPDKITITYPADCKLERWEDGGILYLRVSRPGQAEGLHAGVREEAPGTEGSGTGGVSVGSAPIPASYKGRNPEKRRLYMRDLMRKRRAEKKEKQA